MNLEDIAKMRLYNQQIAGTPFQTPKEIVSWMGAMQAQDYTMAKWAVGVRLHESTDDLIERAIDKGEIIRIHVLRPTWHFVSSKDIYWMIDLTAPQIKTVSKTRRKQLELTQPLITKSNKVIERALMGNKHLTRTELVNEFRKAKIFLNNDRATHVIFEAELEGIVCSGAIKNRKQTYALLCERVAKLQTIHRDEALAILAKKYFTSHAPATLQDFTWWSGLSASDAKKALEMVKPYFISETIDSQVYWFTNSFHVPGTEKLLAYLLPAFDEFIISYKNRSASLSPRKLKEVVSNNGLFRPSIVVNGQVTGLWSKVTKNDKIFIETTFFRRQNKLIRKSIEIEVMRLAHFLGKKIALNQDTG